MQRHKQIYKKKILFIGPNFFDYENEIIKCLKDLGADVDFISDRPYSKPILKAIIRYRRELLSFDTNKYYIDEINERKYKNYDYVFVIQGECLNKKILTLMKDKFDNSKFILYLWDSLKNKPFLISNLEYFDECYTFDKSDQHKFSLKYRPLFYVKLFNNKYNTKNYSYSLSFVGTAHSDRYKIIKDIKRQIPSNKLFYCYLYLQAKWMYYFYKIFNTYYKGAVFSEFNYKSLNKEEVSNIFLNSFAILDIEHSKQHGLTMRTFEALGARKKLLTTNSTIKDADFYNPNNICILERNNTSIPKEFFSTPYEDLSDSLYYKYSIEGWLQEVIK